MAQQSVIAVSFSFSLGSYIRLLPSASEYSIDIYHKTVVPFEEQTVCISKMVNFWHPWDTRLFNAIHYKKSLFVMPWKAKTPRSNILATGWD